MELPKIEKIEAHEVTSPSSMPTSMREQESEEVVLTKSAEFPSSNTRFFAQPQMNPNYEKVSAP